LVLFKTPRADEDEDEEVEEEVIGIRIMSAYISFYIDFNKAAMISLSKVRYTRESALL